MRKPWLGALLCTWALFITYLFLAPPDWSVLPKALFPPMGDGPTAWLRPAGHGAALLHVLRMALFSGGSWNWMVEGDTWRELALGAAGLGAMMLVGWLVLSCFRVYVPRGAAVALWFGLGVGTCGVLFTFVALAGQLKQPIAFMAYGALVVVLSRLAHRAPRRWLPGEPDARAGLAWRLKRQRALEWERGTWFQPTGRLEKGLAIALVALFSIITALIFYHAVFYPETYWDSLILYLGYARGIFLEHRFPVKVVLQVGVGLGANYPHLYELTGATIATWANHWSTLYLQLAAPLAGLLTLLLVYHTALRVTRSVLAALIVTVLLRSTSDLITYHEYATNYSFALLYAAMFFYCAARYLDEGLEGFLVLAMLAAAFGVYVNYLMGVLWLAWGALVLIAHWPRLWEHGRLAPISRERGRPAPYQPETNSLTGGETQLGERGRPAPYLPAESPLVGGGTPPLPSPAQLAEAGISVAPPPDWCRPPTVWPTLRATLASRRFWALTLGGLAIASVWYVRNWIVTGNPVYAFFTGIFRSTKNFNPEVLASANKEWMAHGLGIGLYNPAEDAGLADALHHRLAGTWYFFVNNGDGRFFTCWLWAPGFVALAVPGAVLCIAEWVAWIGRSVVGRVQGLGAIPAEAGTTNAGAQSVPVETGTTNAGAQSVPVETGTTNAAASDATPRGGDFHPSSFALRLGAVTLLYAAVLFAYHYTIGPFYLYHLLICFAAFGVFMALALRHCGRRARVVLAFWVILCAIMPGLPMALACRKVTNMNAALVALRNPGMPADMFYPLQYGEEPRMWAKVNELCKGTSLLTHENRHLLFDPSITLVHMDDWEVQHLWGLPSAERLAGLKRLGVRYYLRVPFEFDHPINEKLGLEEWVRDGTLSEVFTVKDKDGRPEILYQISY